MLNGMELAGVIAALVVAIVAAVLLRRLIGGVEDTMTEMNEQERADAPQRPIRPAKTHRRRR